MGAQARTRTGMQRIKEMRVRKNRLYNSLKASKLAIDFDGGKKDPPTAAKEPTTARGPITVESYWISRTVPKVVHDVLRISTPRGSFGRSREDSAAVGSAIRSVLSLPPR